MLERRLSAVAALDRKWARGTRDELPDVAGKHKGVAELRHPFMLAREENAEWRNPRLKEKWAAP